MANITVQWICARSRGKVVCLTIFLVHPLDRHIESLTGFISWPSSISIDGLPDPDRVLNVGLARFPGLGNHTACAFYWLVRNMEKKEGIVFPFADRKIRRFQLCGIFTRPLFYRFLFRFFISPFVRFLSLLFHLFRAFVTSSRSEKSKEAEEIEEKVRNGQIEEGKKQDWN